jgi:hypothetical protein
LNKIKICIVMKLESLENRNLLVGELQNVEGVGGVGIDFAQNGVDFAKDLWGFIGLAWQLESRDPRAQCLPVGLVGFGVGFAMGNGFFDTCISMLGYGWFSNGLCHVIVLKQAANAVKH